MKRFFPILAVLSFFLYPINTMGGGPDQGNGAAFNPQTSQFNSTISDEYAGPPDGVYGVGVADQESNFAIDPQSGEVYPPISGESAVPPKWVYPFPGLTTFKTPSIEPPRSPPYRAKKQKSKSASVSSGKKPPISGDGGASIVVYGSDGTKRIVHPSQAKKVFKDGTVVYGLDN